MTIGISSSDNYINFDLLNLAGFDLFRRRKKKSKEKDQSKENQLSAPVDPRLIFVMYALYLFPVYKLGLQMYLRYNSLHIYLTVYDRL